MHVRASDLTIQKAVKKVARQIDQAYPVVGPVVIGVLNGAFMFLADLVRAMQTSVQAIHFVHARSYVEGYPGDLEVDLSSLDGVDLNATEVLLVDDICDSGSTLYDVAMVLSARGANVRTCVMLKKEVERAVPITPDFYALKCPNQFVIGYGLDGADGRGRDFPFIAY